MQIRIPKEDVFYVAINGITGPYHDSGEPFEIIEIDEGNNSFHQGNRLYDETSVSHIKSDATITINSLLTTSDVVPDPRPTWTTGTHKVTMAYSSNGSPVSSQGFPATLAGGTALSDNFATGGFNAIQQGVVGNATYYASMGGGRGNYPAFMYHNAQVHELRPIRLPSGKLDPNFVEVRTKHMVTVTDTYKDLGEALKVLATLNPVAGPFSVIGNWSRIPKLKARHPYTANVEKALSWYRKFSNQSYFENPALPVTQDIGDLVQAACENVNPNTINAIAFLKDLKDVKSLVPKLKKLKDVSTHASNYLGVEYGILPTIDDLKTIWESFQTQYFYDRNGFQRASSYDEASVTESVVVDGVEVTTTTTVNSRVHLAISTLDTGLDALTERLRKIGIFPSLTNLWDLVPYSFVLDWFVDVGSVLERIDTRHQLSNLDIKYCLRSKKITSLASYASANEGLFVSMTSSSYNRTVGTSVPQPRIFKENRVTAQNHWIEGSALILARKPK